MKHLFGLMLFAATTSAWADQDRSQFRISYLTSTDEVRFDIAADPSGSISPNILSELHWDDMSLHRLHVGYEYTAWRRLKLFAEAEFGLITDGDGQDSDYAGDNRTDEFSRSTAEVDGKHHTAGALGLGYQFSGDFTVPLWKISDGKRVAFATDYTITPSIGYGYIEQDIEFTDGVQVIPDSGPFPGLNSSYKPEWRGVFLGLDSEFRLFRNLYFATKVRYFPDANYRAKGQWNLRWDLKQPESLEDSADAHGYQANIGLKWAFSDKRKLEFAYQTTDFSSDAGSAEVNTIFGFSVLTRLNEASWRGRGWTLGFEWRF